MTKSIQQFVATIATLLFLLAACTGYEDVPHPVDAARFAAVNLSVYDADRDRFVNFCSGSVVNTTEGRFVLTAGHCVTNTATGEVHERQIFAKTSDGAYYPVEVEEATFSTEDGNLDYALLSGNVVEHVPFALNLGRTNSLEAGDRVWAWSGPLGIDLVLASGYVSGRIGNTGIEQIEGMYFVSINSDGGSSGSAVLNEHGQVVGILVLGFTTEVKLGGVMIAQIPEDIR